MHNPYIRIYTERSITYKNTEETITNKMMSIIVCISLGFDNVESSKMTLFEL